MSKPDGTVSAFSLHNLELVEKTLRERTYNLDADAVLWARNEIEKLSRHVDFLERALVASEKQAAKLSEELENE